MTMVGSMAKIESRTDRDELVLQARTRADALGELYELYYDRIFRFCVHRLFDKEIAEDVTSTVFLSVAEQIGNFAGTTERDFRGWIYAIAANHVNSHIRKYSRRKQLLAKATRSMQSHNGDDLEDTDWPIVYQEILKLKPKHQTIVTLRFFENMEFEQIAEIVNAKEATVRVMLHRTLSKLRNHLQGFVDGDEENE